MARTIKRKGKIYLPKKVYELNSDIRSNVNFAAEYAEIDLDLANAAAASTVPIDSRILLNEQLKKLVFPVTGAISYTYQNGFFNIIEIDTTVAVVDFELIPFASSLTRFQQNGVYTINSIVNAHLLTSIVDVGTGVGFQLANVGLSQATLNSLFTQLPTTSATITVDVRNNPGSATCYPTIATAKGYIVVTS